MQLSDTQLLILSSASQRTDRAALLPENLKGSAAKKVVARLLKEKLLQELCAKDDMPVWRRGDDNRPYSLQITKAGLRAIEVDEVAEAPNNKAATDSNAVAAATVSGQAKSSERRSLAKRSGTKKTAAVFAKATKASSDRIRSDSKQDKILTLLQRPKGTTLDALVKETQWQEHSVRGFLAGTVRKKLKLPLLSEKIDGVRTYRIGTGKAAKSKKTSAARRT
jgi:dihydroxyacetone kinase-like predicted kinase